MSIRSGPATSSRAPQARGKPTRKTPLLALVLLLLLLLAGGAVASVIIVTHHTVQYRYRTRVVIRRVPVIRYRTRTVTVNGVACWEQDGAPELSPAGTGPLVPATCRAAYVSPASSGLVKIIAPNGAVAMYKRIPPGS